MASIIRPVHMRLFYRDLDGVLGGSNPLIAVIHTTRCDRDWYRQMVVADCGRLASPYDSRQEIEIRRWNNVPHTGEDAVILMAREGQARDISLVVGTSDRDSAVSAAAALFALERWLAASWVATPNVEAVDEVVREGLEAYQTPVVCGYILQRPEMRWVEMLGIEPCYPLWFVEPKRSGMSCPRCWRPLPEFPFKPYCRCGVSASAVTDWQHTDNLRWQWHRIVEEWQSHCLKLAEMEQEHREQAESVPGDQTED